MHYKLVLDYAFTDESKPTPEEKEHSGGSNYWSNMGDAGLAAMLAAVVKADGAAAKAANSGGHLRLVVTSAVTSRDGGAIPPGANTTKTYDGIDRHGKSDIDDFMHDLGEGIKKMGRDNATKKEGPKKPHPHP